MYFTDVISELIVSNRKNTLSIYISVPLSELGLEESALCIQSSNATLAKRVKLVLDIENRSNSLGLISINMFPTL
jgi:hypothetical protein